MKHRPLLAPLPCLLAVAGFIASPSLASETASPSVAPIAPVLERLHHPDSKLRIEAIQTLEKLALPSLGWHLAPLLAETDPALQQAAIDALIRLQNPNPPLALLSQNEPPSRTRKAALHVLQQIQREQTVTALLERLSQQTEDSARLEFASALCGLHWKKGAPQNPQDPKHASLQPWSQSQRIAESLQALLNTFSEESAAALSFDLARHRIRLPGSLEKLAALSRTRPDLREPLARLSAQESKLPSRVASELIRLLKEPSAEPHLRLLCAQALAKTSASDLSGLQALNDYLREQPFDNLQKTELREVFQTFQKAPVLGALLPAARAEAAALKPHSLWAETLLVLIASHPNPEPKVRQAALEALQTGWKSSAPRQRQILATLLRTEKPVSALEVPIALLLEEADGETRRLAAAVLSKFKLDADHLLGLDQPGPLLATLSCDEAVRQSLSGRGRKSDGQQLFRKQGCTDCHSISDPATRRAPFLGRIGLERSRQDLAESLLQPDRSILKGYETQVFKMQDGREFSGLILRESGTETVILDSTAKEMSLETPAIETRGPSPHSLMPPLEPARWTLRDFRSLLDYLQSLGSQTGTPAGAPPPPGGSTTEPRSIP